MLESLIIENFAIIERVVIDFTAGMTVLSGETGAGKSIIIDALGILCGGRGSVDFIRHGSDRFKLQGLFSFPERPVALLSVLEEAGLEWQEEDQGLIIQREINQAGRNVIRINGQLANVSLLKTLGRELVDIHGQNEHQTLLDDHQHQLLLDSYLAEAIGDDQAAYLDQYHHYQQLRRQYQAASQDEVDQTQRLEFLNFQLKELEAAQMIPGEEAELAQISRKLQCRQETAMAIEGLNYLFSESDSSILSQLDQADVALNNLTRLDPTYQAYADRLASLKIELADLAHDLAYQSDQDDLDDQSLDEVEDRLGELASLKRKYHRDIEDLITYRDEIAEEIYQIDHRDQYLGQLRQQLLASYQALLSQAQDLAKRRETGARQLEAEIEAELADLYMPNARFLVHFQPRDLDPLLVQLGIEDGIQLTESGLSRAVFYIVTNVGEEAKPLAQVASGGELSRLMLALKTVFARSSQPRTMVFDEIDTGVSGRVAQAIAEKMHEISDHHQVLCITHLPQVAAMADHQLYIHKQVVDTQTQTAVKRLGAQADRVEVIAEMIAGKEVTASSLQVAQDLLTQFHGEERAD